MDRFGFGPNLNYLEINLEKFPPGPIHSTAASGRQVCIPRTAIAWRTHLHPGRPRSARPYAPRKVANSRGAVQRVPSPPQAPLTLSRPAAGAAHGVDDARASELRPAGQCKSGSALRAHALAGSTAVKQAAVRRQAGVERSGRRVAAQVMSMRYEASHVTNAGQGAPSTVPARLPPRSSAQMINSCVAEHQLARLDEPAGRVTAAEDARGGSSRLSGRPLARGGW